MFHPHATIMANIKMTVSHDWNLIFIYTLHEGNSCANLLAKTGAYADIDLVIWNTCLPQLAPLVLADAMGVVHLRS